MTDRPTPEQIAMSPDDTIYLAKTMLLSDLRFYGYVIVHEAELRAMQKRIIIATLNSLDGWIEKAYQESNPDAIIAAAEQETS